MSVLIGTKVKNAEIWLPRFINEVEKLEGDIQKIVVMYGKSTDQTLSHLLHWVDTSKHEIEIYKDPYMPPSERHGAFLSRIKVEMQEVLKESEA